jgi:hypothetical protein
MAFVCASTGIGIFCNVVQYQYGHDSLPVLGCYHARTGISIVAFWFSTSMGIVHY